MKFILGKKLEMSQIFGKEGEAIPVTLVEAGPCEIVQVKTEEKDGYSAVQIGFEKSKKKKKTMKGKEYVHIREFKNGNDLKKGDKIDISIFKEGDNVKISGVSKGKGFQGGVKRWGFSGRNATHGTKHEERTLGSIGSAFPQRVLKGKKMPGRTGFERITVKNLKIVKVNSDNNILAIKGAVPGRKGTLLEIRG
jgi:large subunit ribosomal protein L3